MTAVYDPTLAPETPIQQRIYEALQTRTNQIAGRPNVGNLAWEFVQRGRKLPASVLRDYLLITLRSFIPEVRFDVEVSDELDGGSFQHFLVTYEVL